MKEVILVMARRDDLFIQMTAENKSRSSEKKIFVMVKPGEVYNRLGEFVYQINRHEKEDYRKLLSELNKKVGNVKHIIHLWNYESRNLDYVSHGDVKRFLESLKRNNNLGMQSIDFLTEAMTMLQYGSGTCIYYFHHGTGITLQPQNIMIQNWYSCLPEKQSQFLFCSVNLPEQLTDINRTAKLILNELCLSKEKNPEIVQYDENDGRNHFLPDHAGSDKNEVIMRSNGVYLVINNEEDTGWNLALQMLENYKCRIIVIGNNENTENKSLVAGKVDKGEERLFYQQINTASYEAVRKFYANIKEQFHRIDGIIYCLNNNDAVSYEHNISGVVVIDDITAEIPLDFYFIAGGIARPLGYDHRGSTTDMLRFSRGFTVLRNNLVQQGRRYGLSCDFQWNKSDLSSNTALIDIFSRFIKISDDKDGVKEVGNMNWEDAAIKKKLLDKMEQGISRLISELLNIDETKINLDFPISLDSSNGLQFDSISLTQLAEKIRTKYEVDMTPIIFFKYKSLGALVDYLFKKHGSIFGEYYKWQISDGESGIPAKAGAIIHEPAEVDEAVADSKANHDNDERKDMTDKAQWEWLSEKQAAPRSAYEYDNKNAIAIIGASGMFPGSPDLELLWLNLEEKKDLISEIPPERWNWREYYGDPHKEVNKTNIKWGGFINGIDLFDPDFFGISHEEARIMDPQQRIFLENVWQTIEDAGYRISDLSGTKTAVLVGAGASEYYEMLKAQNHKIEEQSSTGKSNSILANRISYLFNFTGPSESIDVACASSIAAIHKAAEYIRTGECELAVAGGVHLILTPDMHIAFNKGGVLSEDGKCRVFDKDASGYVRSEGVGTVLLKPLQKAVADHDHIYAVILGSAINHGGRSNSMTSPSPDAQVAVLVKAYQKAGISPVTVNYIEAHGTATSLGDSIEMMALESAFETLTADTDFVPPMPYCGVGSIKANLGHAEEAAGMAGLFKVIMGMKYAKIPATIHFKELNPYIDTGSNSLYIVDKTINWERMRGKNGTLLPRRAGISAFGFGGVNTHLILEEYKPQKTVVDQDLFLIVLSAQNQPTIRKYAERLLEYLTSSRSQDCAMADMAYTLQAGREEMKERLAIVVKSKDELITKLKRHLAGAEVPNLYMGVARPKTAQKLREGNFLNNGDFNRVAQLWAEGAIIDWKLIYDGKIPNRISLPGYPFDKKSYWFTDGSLLTEQNDMTADYPRNKCVFELIEAQAAEKPDVAAAVYENTVLTYSQLIGKVNKLAAYLYSKGVKDESYVGIFLDRSLDMLAGILAVLKAGGTYIPLDPVFPSDRIRYIIQDAELSYILAQSHNINKLPEFSGQLIVIDKDQEQIEKESRLTINYIMRKNNSHKAEQIAYVIYTSGSTGNPKGVRIYHKSLTNFLCSMASEPGLDENDYLLAVTTLCFDIAGLELYLPLIRGGCVEILPEGVVKDGIKLKEKIEQSSATIMQATPATWQMLLSAGWRGKKGFKVLCGGEALSQELADMLTGYCEEVWNLYGPTETTIWSTVSRQKRGEKVSIGHPIANTQVYILDENQKPVQAGISGELCIGGDGVAKGYVNKPDLTMEKFIPDPFIKGQRIYRTGDQAYFNENGELFFAGRIDNQIKLRGYRIELEEIENVISTIPEIEKAVVAARQEKSGQMNLTVFYTLKQGIPQLKHQDIINVLKERLPDYMIPSAYILLKSMPLSLNLKIDRKALSQIDLEDIIQQYGQMEEGQLRTLLVKDLQQAAARILVLEPEEVDTEAKLGNQGFNSILFTNFAVAINEKFGTAMTAVLFYKYTTISDVAGYLLEYSSDKVQQAYHFRSKAESGISRIDTEETEPIAIIGMYGMMPQSSDLISFWKHLIQNKNLVTEIPLERWDYRNYYGDPHREENKTNSKWGGFIPDVDCFDAEFFRLSPRESELMDPRQRLLIESVWKTFADGGYKPEDFWGTRTGLFIGSISSDYWDVIKDSNMPADGYTLSGLANSILPNRISYLFNLTGPSEAIDTACSSSLVAIDRAVTALRNGDCETALAGGVNLILSPYLYLSLSKNGMLSSDGKCKAFDQSADGYVRGEGVGTILLKPLSKALADHDHVYAVIKSTAVNHGGRSSSLTAPNPEAQSALLVEAYLKAGIDPSAITYIETHGTGTALGDPIEVEALKSAFDTLYERWGKEAPSKPYCGLGAVKTNIGHLEAAAGIAGLLKLVLAMQAGVIPANINFDKLNPYIDLADSYFYLPVENLRWERHVNDLKQEMPRCAGVSSFGFGGANAHIVIEEFITDQEAVSGEANIIVFSAEDRDKLLEYAKLLYKYTEGLENDQTGLYQATLDEIAYTLQTGRDAMEERAALIVGSLPELKEKLVAFIKETSAVGVYRGNISKTQDMLSDVFNGNAGDGYFKALIKGRELNKLAQLWVSGVEIDWTGLYSARLPKKVPLPSRPFSLKRYWISGKDKKNIFKTGPATAALSALIDSNESNIFELCYKKGLSAEDLFIRDHVVMENKIVPAVVYLEMARMAGKLANHSATVTKLKNLVWLRQLEVSDSGRDVFIKLYPKDDAVAFNFISKDNVGENVVHAQGNIVYGVGNVGAEEEYADIDTIKKRCPQLREHDELYRQFNELGYHYGPVFKPISRLHYSETEALALIELPQVCEEDFNRFLLHPSIMEGVLQTLSGLLFKKDRSSNIAFLPFSLGEVEIIRPLAPICYSHIIVGDGGLKPSHSTRYSITLTDTNGLVLAKLKDYSIRPVQDSTENRARNRVSMIPDPVFYYPELKNIELDGLTKGNEGSLLVFDYDECFMKKMQKKIAGENPPMIKLIRKGDCFRKADTGIYEINPSEYSDYQRLAAALKAENFIPSGIIHRWSQGDFCYEADVLDSQLLYGAYSLFYLCKSMAEQKIERETPILYLFQSEAVGAQPLFTALKSMSRAIRSENPKLNCRVIEIKQGRGIDPDLSLEDLSMTVLSELAHNGNEEYVTYQDGKRFVERFMEVKPVLLTGQQSLLRENGVYLITGGLGGLGTILAEYLAQKYKARIVLAGRSESVSGQETTLKRIKEYGGEAVYIRADAGRFEEVSFLAEKIKQGFGRLNGIIHCAGEIRDMILLRKELEDFKAVLNAKVFGTIYLDEVFQSEELDFFAVFSSVSSVLGTIGQTDYAFANGFMDSFSSYRESLRQTKARSGKTLAINWSFWKDGGMAIEDEIEKFITNYYGIMPMESSTGLLAFEAALSSNFNQLLVLKADSSKIKKHLSRMEEETVRTESALQASGAGIVANAKDLVFQIREDIVKLVSEILKIESGKLDLNKDINDYGFDSISFTELANKTNELYQCDMTPAVFFELEVPTIASFVNLLYDKYQKHLVIYYSNSQQREEWPDRVLRLTEAANGFGQTRKLWKSGKEEESAVNGEVNRDQPVAVIGISGVMPQAEDLNEFWDNLEQSRDLITEVPEERFNWRDYYGDPMNEVNKTDSKWGGFMKEIDKFDALFFGISPREAELTDPQHRIYMQIVWQAIEDAGYRVSDLSGTDTGVYVGITNRDYADVLEKNTAEIKTQGVFGNIHPFLPNRISFLLNLHGPSEPIDTLCSSSLVAIHRAVEDIKHGNCEMAIAGGVSVITSPRMYIAFSNGKMLSNDGHCKTFDQSANGFVRGEGAGAIVLKSLDKAQADGDYIYAIIRGTGENHGGHSNSLTAPNAQAQANLLISTYERAQISPDTVSFIETHGTGTILGDPVEINGLKMAFKKMFEKQGLPAPDRPYCGLGSVKSNMGHLEAAAGIAGVLKVILAMKHKKLPASIHVNTQNPYIDIAESPFYIVDSTRQWEHLLDKNGDEVPLIAGVSSFGAGGVNAHVILEEYDNKFNKQEEEYYYELKKTGKEESGFQIAVLSAKNKDLLENYAKSLLDYLERIDNDRVHENIKLDHIAYTLQTGREPMEERLALIVRSVEELKIKLRSFCMGERDISNLYRGSVLDSAGRNRENAADATEHSLDRIADSWVVGTDFDWSLLYHGGTPRRIPLPTYPFARERYWAENDKGSNGKGRKESIHPLVQQNTSIFKEIRFSAEFTGEEFFFTDHVVGDRKMFPGAAYVEMARAAGELAGERQVSKIKNIVWVRPLIADYGKVSVDISLRQLDEGLEFEVNSIGSNAEKTLHAQGEINYGSRSEEPTVRAMLNLNAIRERCAGRRNKKEIYQDFITRGFKYKLRFQPVQEVFLNDRECLSCLKLPAECMKDFDQFGLHPSLLDGALQTVVELLAAGREINNESYMPFSLAELEILHPVLEQECYVYAAFADNEESGGQLERFDIMIADQTGRILAILRNFGILSLKSRDGSALDSIGYYKTVWTEKPYEAGGLKGHVLVFDNQTALKDIIKPDPGSKVVLVKEGDYFRKIADKVYEINPYDRDDYEILLKTVISEGMVPRKILHSWSLSPDISANNLLDKNIKIGFYSLLYLAQVLIKLRIRISLIYLYPCSMDEVKPEFAAVSAMARTIRAENPNVSCTVLGVDAETINKCSGILSKELSAGNIQEPEVVYQVGKRYIKGVTQIDPKNMVSSPFFIKDRGTYLITGGAGALGLLFADYLAKNYKANLILAGRSELKFEQKEKIAAIAARGLGVIYVIADITIKESAENLILTAKAKFGQINGVIHAAGGIKDSFILKKTDQEAAQVMGPKVYGTVCLDELLAKERLDFFAMFSSVSAVTGNTGQCDYAYANSFMDYYAVKREALRLSGKRYGKTLSINWPLWRDGGMPVTDQTKAWMRNNMGIVPLDTDSGIKAFEDGLKLGITGMIVMSGDQKKIKGLADAQFLLDTDESEAPENTAGQLGIREETDEKLLKKAVTEYLKEMLSKEAKLPAERIKTDVPLEKYGIDSLMIVNLNKELERDFHKLSKTLFFEYQTLNELSKYFVEYHRDKVLIVCGLNKINQVTSTANVARPASSMRIKPNGREDIAIVGLSGIYPMAENLEQFWDNLKAGRDSVIEIPDDRWDYRKYYDPDKNKLGKTYSKWGSFINDVDKFDPVFFNISPREAEFMDPQERLFLSTVWHTLEDAGYTRESINKNKVGVFAGIMYGQYQLFERYVNDSAVFGDSFYASIANRVSYIFDFQGPSISLDTMCSSSVTAVHLACESIRRGECELAFAGGVNISIHPNKYIFLSRAKYVSSDGRCRSFGEGGDGYVPGEGVGAILLKPLSQALQDNDHIYAVIKGDAINHGGKTNGYSVPNPNAQADVIRETLNKAEISSRTISYLEAHGTGTSLGDPIEIAGLTKAYGGFTGDKQYCPIGSVKSNIGHLEAAAGIAALTKVLLQMKHKQLVPSIHSDVLNPNINFDDSPFYVQRDLTEWSKPVIVEEGARVTYPRRAGISAFGAGGSNAHIILEEYEDERSGHEFLEPQIIIISAKNDERLGVYAGEILHFLRKNPDLGLDDVAFTLQIGREAMNERIAIIAAGMEELLSKLEGYQNGDSRIEALFRGNIKKDAPKLRSMIGDMEEEYFYNELITRKDYRLLTESWAYGAEIDWMLLYNNKNTPRRVSLPTYPFLKEQYWVSDVRARLYEPDIHHVTGVAKLHAFIDANVSTLQEEKFLTGFTGADYFLSDHVISNRMILPGAVYLEMARAAGELATGKKVRRIQHVCWSRPLIVENLPVPVYTGLFPENDYVGYEVTTRDGTNRGLRYSYGELIFEDEGSSFTKPQPVDINSIKDRCANTKGKEEIYQNFADKGIKYGSSFRVVQELYGSREEVLSVIRMQQDHYGQFGLHPLAIDGAFQSAAMLVDEKEIYLPYSVDEIEIWEPLAGNMFYVYASSAEYTGGVINEKRVNILITNEKGECLVEIKELLFKKSTAEKMAVTVKDNNGVIYFGKAWKQTDAVPNIDLSHQEGAMVIFDMDSRIYDCLIERFKAEGKDVRNVFLINPGSCYGGPDNNIFNIDYNSEDDYYRLFADLSKHHAIPEKIIYMQSGMGLDYLNYNSDYVKLQLKGSIYPLFYLTKAFAGMTAASKLKLLYVYKGLENEPLYAAVSGFLKSAAQENRKYAGRTVRITFSNEAAVQPDKLLNLLLPEFDGTDGSEVMIDYDTRDRFTASFKELMPETDSKSMLLKEHGVYLITGGTGELGLIFAEYLAKQVKAKLALIGRSDLTGEKPKRIGEIEALGSEVIYLKGDVFNQDDMEGVIKAVKLRYKNIHGIIHSAGVTRDSLILHKDKKEIEEVLAPKIYGSMVLDEVTKNEKLEFMIFFSSITGVMGNSGQSDYAYGNSFMDNFAEYREKLRKIGLRHGKTISINWPLWAAGGMTVNEQTRELLTKTMGTDVLDKDTGLEAFTCALMKSGSQVLVMKGNVMRIREKVGLVKTEKQAVADMSVHEQGEQIIQGIETELVKFISQVLKVKQKDIEVDEEFNNYGFDSVSITEIVNLINEKFNLIITPANFYEHSTVAAFAKGLYEEYKEEFARYYQDTVNQTAVEAAIWNSEDAGTMPEALRFRMNAGKQVNSAEEPVAIIGIGGVMPQSGDPETFWRNLVSGKDLITEIPEDRWDWKAYYGDANEGGNKTMAKWGGFMNGIDKFDNEFFGISPHEANLMDPQQRIFLETVWKTIEDAGYKVSDFSGTKTGVFVGVSNMDYYELINEYQSEIEAHISTGNAHSIIANRISFLLNIHGPSEPVNTACSSSLVTIHRAVEAICSGSCGMAIAGGVNVIISPRLSISFDKAGMLSSDGRCKTFDKSANGYVRGEGAGAVLLKPLRKAKADGDHIYAIIRGTAVNHCGRTNSLTAPSPKAQADVIMEAIEKAGVNPANITYIEAHGTGTSLGDPIEINGLKKVFTELLQKRGEALPKPPYCGIGAVKTNIGHLESAAGIASLLKVILAIKYQTIPQNVHFEELNPYIDLRDSPFYIADKTIPWKTLTDKNGNEIPRIAGVSSFGFGGVNAHVILEEYNDGGRTVKEAVSKGGYLFVLSARNREVLKVYAKNVLSVLRRLYDPVKQEDGFENHHPEGDITLADLCYTLQVGREPMKSRIAIHATEAEELIHKLTLYLEGRPDIEDCYSNEAADSILKPDFLITGKPEAEYINSLVANRQISMLAQLWAYGADIDWSLLYKAGAHRRIPLQLYPFERKRFWINSNGFDIQKAPKPELSENNGQMEDSTEETKDRARTVLAEVLALDKKDIDENTEFAAMGLDSILGIKLVKQLNKEFGFEISPIVIIEKPTLSCLSKYMTSLTKTK